MGFFKNTPAYDTRSVRETLEHAEKPKLTQTTLFSMEPAGYCGSVYEDPRGTNVIRIMATICVAIAVVIVLIVGNSLYQRYAATQEVPDSVKALSDQSGMVVPAIGIYRGMDDADIYTALSSSYTMYQIDSSEDGMSCLNLPAGVDATTIATYYMEGFSNLELDQIANLLRTTWFFSTSHSTSGNVLKVKYADFTSGSVPYAINNALEKQGLTAAGATVLMSGTDDNGNTYRYGTFTFDDGSVYYWKVAACPLDEVYAVDGLPSAGVYVGVTMTNYAFMEESTTATS